MGSFIINENGNSGYSRADFVSALGGLQPLLVSGQNIKTINGNSVLGSGNIEVKAQQYDYDLSQVEQALQTDTIAKLNSINPNHKFMAFGFMTDLHESYDNIGYSGDGSGKIITSKHCIKLLGSIGHTYGLDAVLFGGDYSLGGDLTYSQYDAALEEFADTVEEFVSVPHYCTEGNHDRRYNGNVACRGNSAWLTFLKRFNSTGAIYIDNQNSVNTRGEKPYEGYVGNTYYVDFPAHKVRVIMLSQYEKSEQQDTSNPTVANEQKKNLYDAMKFAQQSDAADYTLLSVSHYCDTSYFWTYANKWLYANSNTLNGGGSDYFNLTSPPNGNVQGKAVVGQIYGHVHLPAPHAMDNGKLSRISVRNAFTEKRNDGNYQQDDYRFSIFVIDTDNWMLHEIKVGSVYNTSENEYYDSNTGIFSYPIKHN